MGFNNVLIMFVEGFDCRVKMFICVGILVIVDNISFNIWWFIF